MVAADDRLTEPVRLVYPTTETYGGYQEALLEQWKEVAEANKRLKALRNR